MSEAVRRVALVTGGSSGIGASICHEFADKGIRVFSLDIEAPDAIRRGIEDVRCNILSDTDTAAVVEHVEASAGRMDILVNNAGGAGAIGRLEDMTSEVWDATIALLLGGARRMMTLAIPKMRGNGGGAIINIASICAEQPGWGGAAYSVAKAALVSLTRMAAAELATDNIRVNGVSPGFIATPLFGRTRGLDNEARAALAHHIGLEAHGAQPLPIAGRPIDVAKAVSFLASEEARFVTGEILRVDGGLALAPSHTWDAQSTSPVLRALEAARSRFEAGRAR